MKNLHTLLLTIVICFAALGSANAQSSKGKAGIKLIDMLVGQWQIIKIDDGNKNTQVSSHPEAMQHIEFTREAKFIVRNNSTKADSGLFRVNESNKYIYFESANHSYPSEWKADLKNSMLTLTKRDSTNTKPVRYVYSRRSNVQRSTSKEHSATNKKQ